MITAYMVRNAAGEDLRIIRLPDDCDPNDQLSPGEYAVEYDAPRAMPAIAPFVITEDVLLAQVDAGREAAQMTLMTAGGAKKYVYNRKAVEAIDARGVLVATLNALSLIEKKKRFPFATAEAALSGEALSVVLARYDTAMTTSSAKIAAIEAQAQKAKRDIRAATTLAAKQAAAKVQWST